MSGTIRKIILWVLSLAVALTAALEGIAQTLPSVFHHLTETDGLSDNRYCYFLKQDSRGFIWTGNMKGLNRFDGLKVKVFMPQPGREGSMVESGVVSPVLEDENGNLWFSTFRFLQRYDRSTERFQAYKLNGPDGKPIEEDYFVFHLERANGRLWLTAGGMVFRYNIRDTSDYQSIPISTTGKWFAVDTNRLGQPIRIWGSPWLNGDGVELFERSEEGHWKKQVFLDRAGTTSGIGPIKCINVVVQNDSLAWLFSEQGLILLNRYSPEKARLFQPPNIEAFSCHNGLFLDSRRLLVSTKKNGLWLFDTKAEQFIRQWAHDKENPSGLSSSSPRGLLIDRENRLWVSHFSTGVDYSSFGGQAFRNPLKAERLTSYRVASIVPGHSGQIWVGTAISGVFLYSANGELLKKYPSFVSGPEWLRQLLRGEDDGFWAITTHACYRLSDEGNWTRVVKAEGRQFISAASLPSGRLLLSTTQGIYEIKKKDRVPSLNAVPELEQYDGFEFMHLYRAASGPLFVPFKSNEIWAYEELPGGTLKKVKTIVLNAEPFSFSEGEQGGSVWVGTSKGVLEIDASMNARRMLLNSHYVGTVFGVLPEAAEKLWLFSDRGIWRHDTNSSELLHFRKEDGLHSTEFSYHQAFAAAPDGKLWAGHADGLTVFHPDSISPYLFAPRPYIESLLVNSAPYDGDTSVSLVQKITLDYTQHTLAFELRAIGYFLPRLSILRYRLLGYEEQWSEVENGGVARFTKVPPGDYRLEAIALNAHGKESPPIQLAIHIKPPFWDTLWFKSLMVFLALAAIAGAIRAYIQRKLREQRIIIERQKAQSQERNRIAGELHDDLGAGLSTISFLSGSLLKEEKEPEKHSSLKEIFQSANGLVESIEEIIWALNAENDALENLVDKLRAYAARYLSANKIGFGLHFPEEIPAVKLSGEKRRNIYLIAKESLHNIVKHARAEQVQLRLAVENGRLLLSIADDGAGFSPQQGRPGGNGLRNMNKRAAATNGTLYIDSTPGKGTQIHLAVPLDSENDY